jgi:hypothetical protein
VTIAPILQAREVMVDSSFLLSSIIDAMMLLTMLPIVSVEYWMHIYLLPTLPFSARSSEHLIIMAPAFSHLCPVDGFQRWSHTTISLVHIALAEINRIPDPALLAT